jgi:hypothetical protein
MDIRRETLWFNKNITTKTNGKEIRWDRWHKAGINIIHDITKANGTFLSSAEIELKYNTQCNVMQYNMLKESIPQEWRRKLKTMTIPVEAVSFEETIEVTINNRSKPINQVKNRDFYWVLIKNCQHEPIVLNRILDALKIEDRENFKWGNIFTVNKAVRDRRLKAFQYKILFDLIPCNKYLHQIGKSDTQNCEKCNIKDDLFHYFYNCEHILPFWNSFRLWWENIAEEELILNCTTIKFGIYNQVDKNETLNACIIYAKWHIYKNKL